MSNFLVSVNEIVLKEYRIIHVRTRQLLIWVGEYLVPYKAEGAEGRLKVPHHNTTIQRAGHKLFQVGIEGNASHSVLVSPERPL